MKDERLPSCVQALARSLCAWLKESMATKPPVHDEALLVLESMVRRGLVETGAALSTLMEWRPMQRPELSNAALRCIAALFMRGRIRWPSLPNELERAYAYFARSLVATDALQGCNRTQKQLTNY